MIVGSSEVFEAISHPIRIRILEMLVKKPLRFADLKRRLGFKSSGQLDFHLKKLRGLIELDDDGRYTLTAQGYAALQALATFKRYWWQRWAFHFNAILYLLANLFCFNGLSSVVELCFTCFYGLDVVLRVLVGVQKGIFGGCEFKFD
ncbi:MAG: hypothetical protein DRJ26_01960 [Candidatus Methanomethylicota archaeon]|uniref:HTH arsR-type domain-containing protein n=1 Tax=Thermoproteota archaeon TaxID=2056631 RepID=A0A497F4E4_9CREN|nr:MAG: hypothetical protein DRJ26_01960 [Candidatus Verstraetearchaeota archaeon]